MDKMYKKERLWNAINNYTESCGGDPESYIHGNPKRMAAVAMIESIVFDEDGHEIKASGYINKKIGIKNMNEPEWITGAEVSEYEILAIRNRWWKIEEECCVWHWIVAEDEAQVKGILAGMLLTMGIDPDDKIKFEITELFPRDLVDVKWFDDAIGCSRPAIDMLQEQSYYGPAYVACSEY